jgi:xanthine dehydrogenase accessory factor
MAHWSSDALAALRRGEAAALISILSTRGSAPRAAGTRMVVTEPACRGTIGGGALEYQAVAQARRVLAMAEGSWRVQDYPLGPLLGQCCGGHVRLQIERLGAVDSDWLAEVAQRAAAGQPFDLRHRYLSDRVARVLEPAGGEDVPADGMPHGIQHDTAHGPLPARPVAGDERVEPVAGCGPTVLLVGAGHVGRAVAGALAGLPMGLTWIDTRPDYATGGATGGADHAAEAAILAKIAAMTARHRLLVMTHDHGLDYRLVSAGLRSAAGFVGVIGSGTKKVSFLSRLAKDGLDGQARARLVCPVGLAGITGKEPGVIAVAVAAQLLLLPA